MGGLVETLQVGASVRGDYLGTDETGQAVGGEDEVSYRARRWRLLHR